MQRNLRLDHSVLVKVMIMLTKAVERATHQLRGKQKAMVPLVRITT